MRLVNTQSGRTLPALAPKLIRRARIAVICAEYNREITESLGRKCLETLVRAGIRAANIHSVSVPGCLEIPLAAQRLARARRYHAMIALGAVIRGETYHFDLVANECARGVMRVSLEHDVPIIFEILATYNHQDALRRAGNNARNKGIEAARAALAILETLDEIEHRR